MTSQTTQLQRYMHQCQTSQLGILVRPVRETSMTSQLRYMYQYDQLEQLVRKTSMTSQTSQYTLQLYSVPSLLGEVVMAEEGRGECSTAVRGKEQHFCVNHLLLVQCHGSDVSSWREPNQGRSDTPSPRGVWRIAHTHPVCSQAHNGVSRGAVERGREVCWC